MTTIAMRASKLASNDGIKIDELCATTVKLHAWMTPVLLGCRLPRSDRFLLDRRWHTRDNQTHRHSCLGQVRVSSRRTDLLLDCNGQPRWGFISDCGASASPHVPMVSCDLLSVARQSIDKCD